MQALNTSYMILSLNFKRLKGITVFSIALLYSRLNEEMLKCHKTNKTRHNFHFDSYAIDVQKFDLL